jgi:hypothetical protein
LRHADAPYECPLIGVNRGAVGTAGGVNGSAAGEPALQGWEKLEAAN